MKEKAWKDCASSPSKAIFQGFFGLLMLRSGVKMIIYRNRTCTTSVAITLSPSTAFLLLISTPPFSIRVSASRRLVECFFHARYLFIRIGKITGDSAGFFARLFFLSLGELRIGR